jgi:hypothetical protein
MASRVFLLISNGCIAVDPNSSRSPRPGDIQIGHIATVQRSMLWPLADICSLMQGRYRAYESRSAMEIWNIPISDQVTSPSMRRVKLKGHGVI